MQEETLKKYIQECKEKNIEEDSIIRTALEKGYPKDIILESFKQLKEPNTDIQEEKEDLDDFEDETEDSENEEPSNELDILKEKLKELDKKIEVAKFARVETKPEFASEIVNTGNNQKIANLQDYEVLDLLEKRKFYNLLKNFGWDRLANRMLCNIQDVENYSLSQDGFLIESVLTDKSKQATYSYNTQKLKGGKSNV